MKKKVLSFILVVLSLLFVGAALADVQYQGQTAFTNPVAVATSATCGTYIAGNGIVEGGDPLVQWPVTDPSGLAIASACNVYVAGDNRIQVFDSVGNPITQWAVINPTCIAIGPSGDVYVADATGNLVNVFDANGAYITQWAVINPTSIAIGPSGDVYIADATGNIQIFYPNGVLFTQWSTGSDTNDIAVGSSDFVFTLEDVVENANIYYATGSLLSYFPVTNASRIAVSLLGDVYIISSADNTVSSYYWYYNIITSITSGSGTISPAPGTTSYPGGTTQIITATPAAGQRVGDLMVNGTNYGSITSLLPSMVRNYTVSVTFIPDVYTLTTSVTSGSGTISPATGSFPAGTTQTITATPAAGQKVGNLMVNGANYGSITSLAVTMNRNHTASVTFVPNTFTLTTSVTSGSGTITPVSGSYPGGSVQTIVATPAAGQKVGNLMVNGANYGSITSLAVTMNRNHTASVTFVPN